MVLFISHKFSLQLVESWSNKLEKSQSDVQLKQVRVCAEIGIECIDSNPAKRPDTQRIINILNEYTEIDVITSEQAEDDLNELHQYVCNASSAAKSMRSLAPALVRTRAVVEIGLSPPPPAAMVASAEYFECHDDNDLDASELDKEADDFIKKFYHALRRQQQESQRLSGT